MTAEHPVTYHKASGGNLADQINRFRELAEHDALARAIVTGKARGTYEPNKYVNEDRYPPLTVAGHLEMLALGEVLARYYRHPARVHAAILAGATWEQIAAATGTSPDLARQAYRDWAEEQHRLRQQFPDEIIGLGDEEYAAALKAVGDVAPAAEAGDGRRLAAIRGVLARFDWEHDDRQL